MLICEIVFCEWYMQEILILYIYIYISLITKHVDPRSRPKQFDGGGGVRSFFSFIGLLYNTIHVHIYTNAFCDGKTSDYCYLNFLFLICLLLLSVF